MNPESTSVSEADQHRAVLVDFDRPANTQLLESLYQENLVRGPRLSLSSIAPGLSLHEPWLCGRMHARRSV